MCVHDIRPRPRQAPFGRGCTNRPAAGPCKRSRVRETCRKAWQLTIRIPATLSDMVFPIRQGFRDARNRASGRPSRARRAHGKCAETSQPVDRFCSSPFRRASFQQAFRSAIRGNHSPAHTERRNPSSNASLRQNLLEFY